MASDDETVNIDALNIDNVSTYESGSETDDNSDSIDENTSEQELKERQINIVSVNEMYDNYTNANRVTKPFMTRFEKAKIIGVRSEMLANGAPALISVPKEITSTYKIAEMEYKEKKIPLIIKRKLPNNTFEYWKMDDLVLA
tara:strand:- start:1413 stop:1838 length:426 start_codon:yes stop_codon:yes gene_type:complete